MEEELDFNEEEPFDLSGYDQYFEWDEAEYIKLQFIAAQHYASRGHWDDAYAYVLRSQPDDVLQHEILTIEMPTYGIIPMLGLMK